MKSGVAATKNQQAPTSHAEQKFHQLPTRLQTWPVLTLHQIPQGQPADQLSFSQGKSSGARERWRNSHSARQKDSETESKEVPYQMTRNLPF